MNQTFPIEEVARILGIPVARIRAMVDAGVCAPARTPALTFTFQDLVRLRAAKSLLEGISIPRLKRVLRNLARRVPPGGVGRLRVD